MAGVSLVLGAFAGATTKASSAAQFRLPLRSPPPPCSHHYSQAFLTSPIVTLVASLSYCVTLAERHFY